MILRTCIKGAPDVVDEITGPVTVLNGEWCIPVAYPNMFLEGDIIEDVVHYSEKCWTITENEDEIKAVWKHDRTKEAR
nr:MAG TPA: hypothetical protein [Caudoviricetes sp.]